MDPARAPEHFRRALYGLAVALAAAGIAAAINERVGFALALIAGAVIAGWVGATKLSG